MAPHVDILDEKERLGKPLIGSAVLHGALFAALLISPFIKGRRGEAWGDLTGGGPGSMSITVVNRIPLPARSGVVNPLAQDTPSAVPAPPPKAKVQQKAPAPDPDAVALKSKTAPKRPSAAESSVNRFRANEPARPNQVYSSSGQALTTPMLGQTGGGGVGVGQGSPFGNRFGNYVNILRQRVAEKWRTVDVDPRIQTAPTVIVTFMLMRDGSVKDVQVAQRSGNAALDYSAQRAVYDAAPFPPLPAGYERNDAVIEFWFDLRR